MNHVPAEFLNDVLRLSFVTGYKDRYTRLSGLIGKCANRFVDKGYLNVATIKNGSPQEHDFEFYDIFGKILTFKPKCSKYAVQKYLVYDVIGDQVPSIDLTLPKNRIIDDNWIKLFSSWRSLQYVGIYEPLTEPLRKLLNVLYDQEQLLYLFFSAVNYEFDDIKVIVKFLLQKQFLSMSFHAFDQNVVNEILDKKRESGDLLRGKRVTWRSKAELPDATFKRSEARDLDFVRFEGKGMLVDYCNNTAYADIANDEFMKGVSLTLWRFI
ncbi:hypothetical protein L596_017718 [Steinernema carpocapsae]|uniref:Uncharacterized protein n=1 Tax=Steinernema carpocapsae TaxID=34508 RepID=A0A4U5N3A1_STECR|nr:hypothetical protein L596_017718 [Steinernema carpocapsae]